MFLFLLTMLPVSGNRRSYQLTTNLDHAAPFGFPHDFLWGAGVAGHQVEAVDKNDWSAFEKQVISEEKFNNLGPGHAIPGHIYNYGNATITMRMKKSQFESRLAQDLRQARDLNLNCFRFSFSWAKLFPRPDMRRPDASALSYYRRILRELQKNNLEPIATIFHFTTPQWFWQEKRGKKGWERDDALKLFEQYVQCLVDNFGKSISTWVTINEPMVYVYNGYLEGIFPPNEQRGTPDGLSVVISRLVKAHAICYKLIKRHGLKNNQQTMVGLAHHFRSFEPWRNYHILDRLMAQQLEQAFIWDFLDGLQTGYLKLSQTDFREEVPDAQGSLDFVGLNYYGRLYAKANVFRPGSLQLIADSADESVNLVSDYPHGFYKMMKKAFDRYKMPLYILESGVDDREIDDLKRQEYMVMHLKEIWNALQAGVNVRAYLHHSLLDGFEWAEGFETKFGLLKVDFQNRCRRIPRQSCEIYRQIINNNAINQNHWQKYSQSFLERTS